VKKLKKPTTTKLRSSISSFVIALFAIYSIHTQAQIQVVPLTRNDQSNSSSARTQAVKPKKLPFWDDFSFANSYVPQDSLWQFGKSVWVNNGIGINPPSLGVVTFDGLDSKGKPYNVNDVLAKGYADTLTSQPIQMNLVDPSQRSTVYISFYYQFKGRGEAPDPGDFLRLQFRTKTGVWETVWSVENNETLDPTIFYNVILPMPVNDDRFFYDTFRFRFQNFARLSGPFDAWNIDYVYLNSGRSSVDTSYPDRTLVNPLTSLLKEYYAVPLKHFFIDPLSLLTPAQFTMYNLRVGNDQPMNYYSYARIKNRKAGASTIQNFTLDTQETVGSVQGLAYKTVAIKTLPPISAFDPLADTIELDLKLGLSTKDNLVVNGDYDPTKYSPIDFRWNDTTRTHYSLSNYYAYDDGTAEYGAGVNQPGAQLMYKFNMKTTVPDTIVAVQIYFPRFGDETSQVIQLQIFKDLENSLSSTLHTQTVTVQRSAQDNFSAPITLSRFVGVSGSFYVGWKQNTATVIPVGLDKNTDSGDNIYFNTNGIWEQNMNVKGSLMIRPIFGKGDLQVGLEDQMSASKLYPNPNQGNFFLPLGAQELKIFDITGRSISYTEENIGKEKNIHLLSTPTGLYIIHYLLDGKSRTERIIVRQ
jgi:hypothetical protein